MPREIGTTNGSESTRAFARAAQALARELSAEAANDTEFLPLWLPVALLWERVLRFDPDAPFWPDRDRFVVSSAHLLPLRDAFLRLTGWQPSPPPESGPDRAAVMPELLGLAGGLAGQAIAAAAGMALAEKIQARRFGHSLVSHRTWLIARAGDLESGVALEAAVLAARFQLERLSVIVAAPTGAPDTHVEDIAQALDRIEASGWSIRRVDATDIAAVSAALTSLQRARKPSLLLCEHPGQDATHAATPRRAHRVASAETGLQQDGDTDPSPGEEYELTGPWNPATRRGRVARRAWLRRLARHSHRAEFERTMTSRPAPRLHDDFQRSWFMADPSSSKRKDEGFSLVETGLKGRDLLHRLLPELVSLTAGAPASATAQRDATSHRRKELPGSVPLFPCGTREPGMVGFMNGLALHGGTLPCGTAPLESVDRMRPALRFAALTGQRLLCVLTEEGPASGSALWQQVEQLASLRAMPNLALFRPADADEIMAAWIGAMAWQAGPALIVLGRGDISRLERPLLRNVVPHGRFGPARGGYVLEEATAGGGVMQRDVTLIASGPEVALARTARALLAQDGVRAALISLPCWELFSRQDQTYRDAVLGKAPRVAIEAASGFGWERWIGEDGVFIGREEFGVAFSLDALYQNFGMTPEAVRDRVLDKLGMGRKHAGSPVRAATSRRGGDTRLRPDPIVQSNAGFPKRA